MAKTHEKKHGQAAVIIALSIVLLIAIMGLAIDGGSIYAQRRAAQNISDATALAATSQMLTLYDQMILDNPYDVDGTQSDDDAINAQLTNYASAHGVPRGNLDAYYVTDDKQLVSNIQIGALHSVPWTEGAKGISVKSKAETDAFFMKIFGWDKVGASAASSAFMGIAVDSGSGIKLAPLGFFTDSVSLSHMQIPNEYTIINADVTQESGNWGWLNYNGNGTSATVVDAWLDCGFNPAQSQDEWEAADCAGEGNRPGGGPAQYYTCANADCSAPSSNIATSTFIQWGPGPLGMWLRGSSGATNSVCQHFADIATVGSELNVPVFDDSSGGGSGVAYHLLGIAKFIITTSNINCHAHWQIAGSYQGLRIAGGTGRHGDLRYTSGHTVLLEN